MMIMISSSDLSFSIWSRYDGNEGEGGVRGRKNVFHTLFSTVIVVLFITSFAYLITVA